MLALCTSGDIKTADGANKAMAVLRIKLYGNK